MQVRAAVLEKTGGPLTISELELAPPGPEEVLVRLGASGICHSDWNAIDGTAETRCPAVLGHEGAGVVEAIGERVSRVSVGQCVALSWAPWCGECEECRRDLPQLCSTFWPAMGTGGLMDGTTRLSRGGEPVYHYSLLSTFATACVVSERSCVPIPDEVPFDVAALVGCAVTTGVGAVWRTAQVQAGDRLAVIGCGGVGLSAIMAAVATGADPVIAVDAAPQKLDVARSFGATHGVLWEGDAEATAEAVREAASGGVDVAIEATGRPEAMEAAFLSTRARGAAVLIGIPRQDALLSLPAGTIPRMERRILGSIYGSSKPERDFPQILDLYRAGRLPLDRLVSHRLPLDEVERGFELMHSGDALRVVLDMASDPTDLTPEGRT
ncbi:MAG TPA: Zn-dependent alcohol dehydrogenase [Gaiellaceae bacterium]|nr:Zn-dependent alcohol dehydrogenase [Gaiellaceae bacterium]